MQSRRGGFTLIELLVVISIIALLLAILMPSLSRARGQAKSVTCQSNLRQLGISLTMYADASRSWYPAWSVWHVWGYYGTPLDGTNGDSDGPAWTERLIDAGLPGINIFSCPAFPKEVQVTYFEAAYAAWNRYDERATRADTIRYSSEFVLAGDCTNRDFYAPPFGTNFEINIDDADMDNASFRCLDWSRPAHLKRDNNVLFADGHVDGFGGFSASEMTHDTLDRGIDWGELESGVID